jgi:outer membrane protein
MKKNNAHNTSLIALLLAISISNNANAETLHEALSFTYKNNPSITASKEAFLSTKEGITQAKTGWKPTVTLTGQLSRTSSEGRLAGVDFDRTARNPNLTSIELTQPIFRGGKTLAETAAAKSATNIEEANLKATEQSVLLQAIASYLNVIQDDAILSLNKKNEEVLSKHLETTKYRFTAGEITKTDVSQAKARLAGATANKINASGQLKQSIATYESIIGHSPEEISDPEFPNELFPTSLDDAISIALLDNPSIEMSKQSFQAAKDNMRAIKADFMPTISLSASASRGWDQTERDSEVDTFTGAATLVYPIYQGGLTRSKLRAAKHSTSEAEFAIEKAKREIKNSTTSAWAQYETATAALIATQEQVDAACLALQGIKEEVMAGTRTTLDMLDAENELLNARVEQIKAEKNKKISAFSVLAEIGWLTAENLNLSAE